MVRGGTTAAVDAARVFDARAFCATPAASRPLWYVQPMPDVHPSAWVAPSAQLFGAVFVGDGASIWHNAVLRAECQEVRIGRMTNVQDFVMVHVPYDRPTLVGAFCSITHHVTLHGCTVEDDCLIGMGSVLLNGVHIGTGSVVAAGAVVPEGARIPPGSLVVGVPARVTRPVDDALRARIRDTWEHYVAEAKRHRAGTFPIAGTSL